MADYIKRDLHEADKVHLYVSEIKSQCGKYGENSSRILLDRLKALIADKDEQAGTIMRLVKALEEATEDIEILYGHDTPQTERYQELLGGAEDGK